MKTIIILLLITTALLSCKSNNTNSAPAQKTDSTTTLKAGEYYTCPMHPAVHADKPGSCPICGMPLVKKTEKK